MDTQERARQLMMRRTLQIRNRQQTMLSRAAAEVGQASAEGYSGLIQGKIQPTFRLSYDSTHVALS
ncbi:MAG: hypothetical protein IGQ88_09250 [Gloeomargaritaceae cyanobacterium C42_A2020_066]|nr:hypothetical protein [Gloeomargaritaceae cyanobacterium C42_A2020_066]